MEKIKKACSKMKGSRRPVPGYSSIQAEDNQAELGQPPAQDPLNSPAVPSDVDVLVQDLATSPREAAPMIIQEMVSKKIPKPPADLPQDLDLYLLKVQEAVSGILTGLGPRLGAEGLMGTLVHCCFRQTFDRLDILLQDTNHHLGLLALMNWILQTHLGQEMFDQQEIDLLFSAEWVAKVKSKLLQSVKDEFRVSGSRILDNDRTHADFNDEEACIQLYVDIIQLTEGTIMRAETVSATLGDDVREVCYQQLLDFVQRYAAEQTQTLEKKTQQKINKKEVVRFLKTLKTCKEIRQHVSTKAKGVTEQLLGDIVGVLDHTEAVTLAHIKKLMSTLAESFHKLYFSGKKEFSSFVYSVKTWFPKRKWCQDVMEKAMVEVYKVIVHNYLKHLVNVRPNKLVKIWGQDIGRVVIYDAEVLHSSISELVPGVEPLNLMLLKAAELLECQCDDTVLLTTASMHKECLILREDVDLQMALLRWRGLPAWKVREVLEAIPEHPGPRSRFCCCCC